MGKYPPGISVASAKSTLLGISCSNTFFIDLYQRLCLQSQRGWARYNIAWHRILSECQRRQLRPSAKQNKQVMVHLHHLSNVCLERVLQALTGCKSTCFLIRQVCRCTLSREKRGEDFCFKFMQQLLYKRLNNAWSKLPKAQCWHWLSVMG